MWGDSHRILHGERIDVDGTFSNGCRFPGDPNGPAEEVYNCRCTLVAAIKGFEEWSGSTKRKSLTIRQKVV